MNGRIIFQVGCLLLLLQGNLWAEYRDDISFTLLTNRLGSAQPTGAGIGVSHIEAPENGTNYLPDADHPEFAGKLITDKSAGATNSSGHATWVGQYFYGLTTSMAPAISNIAAYHVEDWIEDGMLRTSSILEPLIESNRVENHSWVGGYGTATNLMLRLDYAIVRDGFTCVVASDNSGGTNLPQIPSQGYNTLCVGRSDGGHSAGFTTFDAAGRVKPDIVAPLSACSITAPTVAAAAALLLEMTITNPAISAAAVPEAIKAILMAGATKDELPSWDRTSTRPLDERYGAGELNIYNSVRILGAGQQAASSTSLVSSTGWNVHTPPGSNAWYIFDVPTNRVLSRLSAMLVWNRTVVDGPIPFVFDPTGTVANLTLTLHAMSNFSSVAVLDQSSSAVDNVEHVYEHGLPPGRYGMEVTTDSATRYCLAWEGRLSLTPEIVSVSASNAQFSVSSTAIEGSFYSLEASTNLNASDGGWAQLLNEFAVTNSIMLTDTGMSDRIRRFYRVVADP